MTPEERDLWDWIELELWTGLKTAEDEQILYGNGR
jgi:hypothetical protein